MQGRGKWSRKRVRTPDPLIKTNPKYWIERASVDAVFAKRRFSRACCAPTRPNDFKGISKNLVKAV